MTADFKANGKHEDEKVPHHDIDGEDDVEDGEEDGAPETGAGGM